MHISSSLLIVICCVCFYVLLFIMYAWSFYVFLCDPNFAGDLVLWYYTLVVIVYCSKIVLIVGLRLKFSLRIVWIDNGSFSRFRSKSSKRYFKLGRVRLRSRQSLSSRAATIRTQLPFGVYFCFTKIVYYYFITTPSLHLASINRVIIEASNDFYVK